MARGRYIAVTGCIGVGKSVFARVIAERLGASLVEEFFEENPYLERFYQPGGAERWGFHTEVTFLASRHDQMQEIGRLLESGLDVVTDWTHYQNLVFASETLSGHERTTYEGLFKRLMASVPEPDLLVHLDADLEVIQKRIAGRGRGMEMGIDPLYLESLRSGYQRLCSASGIATLSMDTTNLPIPHSAEARGEALSAVWGAVGYCPLPSGGRLADIPEKRSARRSA
jgi:deoxyguanosine kinase